MIRIGDFDVEACGGIHTKNTLDVGAIKILRTKRIQDGVVRLEFVAGMPAVEQMMSFWNQVSGSAVKLNSSPERIGEAIEKLMADRKDLMKQLDAFKKGRVGDTVDELLEKAVQVKGAKIVRHVESEDIKHLVGLAKLLIDQPRTVAVLGSDEGGAKVVIARSHDIALDCRPIIKEIMVIVSGSGGGKPDFAQGGGTDASKLEQALDLAVELAKRALEKE